LYRKSFTSGTLHKVSYYDTKMKRMMWTGQVACMEYRVNLCKILVVKFGGNNLLEGTEHRRDCNINIHIKKCIILD